jgi:hypothetical protein
MLVLQVMLVHRVAFVFNIPRKVRDTVTGIVRRRADKGLGSAIGYPLLPLDWQQAARKQLKSIADC